MIDPEGDGDYYEPPPYMLGPDSMPQEGVPAGTIAQGTFDASTIYPGSTRQYWVYLPAGYVANTPVASMVFQDGGNYVNEGGLFRTTIVLDNLISAGDIPTMAAVFVDPGTIDGQSNRSFEYDNLSDDYVRFLLEDFLPYVEATHGVVFSTAPEERGIAGHSSGGICAFTAGWHRSDTFGRIMTHNGSFVDIMGGGAYPQMVTDGAVLPLRVFLLSGTMDLDNQFGNWLDANIAMAAALAARGYHYRFVHGEGSHSPDHAGANMPDTLRWLWREPLVEG
jgi:enterochelin esterase family protein